MNISNTLAASFSLALITALSGTSFAEVGGDPRVRMVELFGDSGYPGIRFSGQGDTITLMRVELGAALLYRNNGQGWELIKRVIGGDVFDLYSFGISDDGNTIAVTGFENVSLIEGVTTTVFPRAWYDSENEYVIGRLKGEALSGDGQHVGVTGVPNDEYDSDALLWDGDSEFINLSWDLPQEQRNYLVRGLSFDGAVAVFGAFYPGPLNNVRFLGSERDVWVWEEGELTMVPPVSASYEVVMRAREMTGNGQAVIGVAQGIWRDGFGEDGRLSEEGVSNNTLVFGPDLSWIWTRDSGTVEIVDLARFEGLSVWDITDDASTVIGSGYSSDKGIRQFLWYRDANEFVMLDDLFAKLGLVINADWFGFSQISGDGSKLLGLSRLDGHYSALIVTVPVRKP